MTQLASLHSIRQAVVDLLGTDARDVDELARLLAADGLLLGADPPERILDALNHDSRFTELADGRWLHDPSVLHGTTWSTAVDPAMASEEVLPTTPDLGLLTWWAIEEPIPLADGSGALDVIDLHDGTDGFIGPVGWLDDFVGGILLVHVHDGAVSLEPADEAPAPIEAQVAAVRAAFDRIAETIDVGSELLDQRSIDVSTAPLDDLLWDALLADRAAFVDAATPPVDGLLDAADLERERSTVAARGTDWDAWRRWRRRSALSSIHDLDDDAAEGLELVLDVARAFIAGEADPFGSPIGTPSIALAVAMYLADGDLARICFGELVGTGVPHGRIADFARQVLDEIDDDNVAVGVRWLLARALDQQGDPIGAEEQLTLAAGADLDFPLARRGLAAFASDRGDAVRALALLEDASVDDDDPLLLEVAGYALQRPRATARRNDPCPCGSGRKYKVCHLGKERHSIDDRMDWLYDKARRYVRDNRSRTVAVDVASSMARASGSAGIMLELLETPLVDDVVLSECGVFDDFLAERSALLPDDEVLLATQWSLVERSVFEIEAFANGTLSLRDLRTGDRITVTNVNDEHAPQPGELLVGRPLPVGDTRRALSGFVSLPDSMRDDAIRVLDDSDPFAVAALIGRTWAPPTMQNTDGEAMVFHELRYALTDPMAARTAFDAAGLSDHGDGSYTLVRDSKNQRDTVIMSFVLDGSALVVSVNSDERAEEAHGMVTRLLPDAELVDDDVRPFDEMLRDARSSGGEAPLGLDDEAVAGALDEHIREMERRWVDEPVPALHDMTPREAADDPIGRVELERLLASYERLGAGQPGTYDVDRLRALLDMT